MELSDVSFWEADCGKNRKFSWLQQNMHIHCYSEMGPGAASLRFQSRGQKSGFIGEALERVNSPVDNW